MGDNKAHDTIVKILYDIRTTIRDSSKVVSFLDGPLVSVKLSKDQQDNLNAQIEAQVRTLRGIEELIMQEYPEAKD